MAVWLGSTYVLATTISCQLATVDRTIHALLIRPHVTNLLKGNVIDAVSYYSHLKEYSSST